MVYAPPSTNHRFLEREFFIDNLLVRIHSIIVMVRWIGLAPWEFEFPMPGSLTSTFLDRFLPNRSRGGEGCGGVAAGVLSDSAPPPSRARCLAVAVRGVTQLRVDPRTGAVLTSTGEEGALSSSRFFTFSLLLILSLSLSYFLSRISSSASLGSTDFSQVVMMGSRYTSTVLYRTVQFPLARTTASQ